MISINAKMLPEAPTEESANLARFQICDKRAKYFGKVHRLRNLDKTKVTANDVKKLIERECEERPEMLRKGGSPVGVVLEDGKTLEECGLMESMDVYEYLWEDSKENIEKYKEEKDRRFKALPYHEKFMEDHDDGEPKDFPDDKYLEQRARKMKQEDFFKDANELQKEVEEKLDVVNE